MSLKLNSPRGAPPPDNSEPRTTVDAVPSLRKEHRLVISIVVDIRVDRNAFLTRQVRLTLADWTLVARNELTALACRWGLSKPLPDLAAQSALVRQMRCA